MENVPRKKYKLRALPATLQPNALYYIKPIGSEEVFLYTTDKNGIPKELKDETGLGSGITNLSYTASPTQGTVVSNTGTDAVIPLADDTNAGLLSSAEKSKIQNSLESGDNTSSLVNNGSDGSSVYVEQDGLSTVAFTGDYDDLSNKPSIVTNLSTVYNPSNIIIESSTGTDATLNLASASTIGVLSAVDWTTFNNKQNNLGYTPENVTNKATDFSTVNDTLYPSVEAVKEELDLKVDKTTTVTIDGVTQDLSTNRSFTTTGGINDIPSSQWRWAIFDAANTTNGTFNGFALNGGTIGFPTGVTAIDDYQNMKLFNSGTLANSGYRYLTTTASGNGSSRFFTQTGLTYFATFCIYSNSSADTVIRLGFMSSLTQVDSSFGAYIQINANSVVFKTAQSGSRTSTASYTLEYSVSSTTEIPYDVLIYFESSSLVKCKLKKYDGTVVFDESINTNIPLNTDSYHAGAVGSITTAGTARPIYGLQKIGLGLRKPNFLNSF